MSVLVGKDTRLLVQGITGSAGAFHAKQMIEYGTQVVAGVTPGRGGEKFEGAVPVFDTVARAARATRANATCIFVPPPGAADAILEAFDAGLELVVCITEGIPVIDMLKVRRVLEGLSGKTRLIGPNCPGIITPGAAGIGLQDRDHARSHSQAGPHRRRVALRDADLRSRRTAHGTRRRAIDVHRHRRRSGRRHGLRRRARALPG